MITAKSDQTKIKSNDKNSNPRNIVIMTSNNAYIRRIEVAPLNHSGKLTCSLWKKYQFQMISTTNAKEPSSVRVAICPPAIS